MGWTRPRMPLARACYTLSFCGEWGLESVTDWGLDTKNSFEVGVGDTAMG